MPDFLVLLLMQVTVFSSVTALIILAVKQIFKCRIPPRIGLMLWVILLARLICPIFPESRISVYNFIPVGRNLMYTLTNNIDDELDTREEIREEGKNPYVVRPAVPVTVTPAVHPEIKEPDAALSLGEYITEVMADNGITENDADHAELVNLLLLGVYGLGILVSLSFSLTAYLRAKKRAILSSSRCTEENLLRLYRETGEKLGIPEHRLPPLRNGITSMLIGCVRQEVVCREEMEKREAEMVFAHELSHFKYGDNPILLFSTAVACMFWYNPLIWIVRNMLREDVEVLCDSRTLTYCGIQPTEYAMMLCESCAYAELTEAGCHMSATGRSLKTRLRTISLGKNRKFLPKIASGLLCAAIVLICLTNPIVSSNNAFSAYIENYALLTGEDANVLYLSETVTVSTYLKQLSTLLNEKCGPEQKQQIGGGTLERFKRLCAEEASLTDDTKAAIRQLRTDDPLTNKNCALLNAGITAILSDVSGEDREVRLLPTMILAADMKSVLEHLTETEAEALLTCYNRGVKGAKVQFAYCYTDAMMELIRSRICDEWSRNKIMGFYRKYDLSKTDFSNCSPILRDRLDSISRESKVYVCDCKITDVEVMILTKLLEAAEAGEREDVYYLKKTEDGCSFDIAERLFRRAEYTVQDMLAGYAEIGETTYVPGSCFFPQVRKGEPVLEGISSRTAADTVRQMWLLGLLDANENGTIDPGAKLSAGQSLAYAYRLVASMCNP